MAAVAGVLNDMCVVMGCKGCYSGSCLLSSAAADAGSQDSFAAVICELSCMSIDIGLIGSYNNNTLLPRADLHCVSRLSWACQCCVAGSAFTGFSATSCLQRLPACCKHSLC